MRRLFLLLLFLSTVDAFAQSGQTNGRFDRECFYVEAATAARCPERTLVVSGFAFASERNAQELALDRACAVMQYYLNLGMSSRSLRFGRAVVQSEDGWIAELWEGRRVSTSLIRE